MNSLGRGNWVLTGVVFMILMMVFVSAVTWDSGATTTNYTTSEDTIYYHNLSKNITGFNNDVIFDIDTSEGNYVYWTNATGRNIVS